MDPHPSVSALPRAAVAAALIVVACTASHTQPPPGTVQAFIEGLAGSMCDWQFRCCTAPEIQILGSGAYTDRNACVAGTVLHLGDRLAAPAAAIGRRRLTLDPGRASTCVDAFERRACNPPAALGVMPPGPGEHLESCPDPFTGRVPIGETCTLSNECVPGARCLQAGGMTDADLAGGLTRDGRRRDRLLVGITSLVGVCHPARGEGEPCTRTLDCDGGRNLFCRRTDFRCAPPAGQGDACSFDADPITTVPAPVVACDAERGLSCRGGHCRTPPRAGEPCLTPDVSSLPCDITAQPPLDCVAVDFTGNRICQARISAGAPCGGSGMPSCEFPLACVGAPGPMGACGQPPAAGAPCALDVRCAPPAVCSFTTGVCVQPGPLSLRAPCTDDTDCASLACGFLLDGIRVACLAPGTTLVTCAGPGASAAEGGTAAAYWGRVDGGGGGGGGN